MFIDPATMPPWLGTIAAWNPLTATAAAVRDLFGSPAIATGAWPSEHALVLAVVFPAIITAALAPMAARAFRNLDR